MATTGSNSSSSDCLLRVERAEGRHFEHAEQRVLGHHRQRHRLDRRGLAETRGDAEVIRREIRERDDLALARTLANQPLTEPDRAGGVGGVGEAVRGHAVQMPERFVEHIETRDAAAQHRHETRKQPLRRTPQATPRPATLP